MAGSPTGGGSPPGGDDTQVQVNSQDLAFYADSGFRYLANSAVTIGRDMLFIYNMNSGGDNYTRYNSGSAYFELYVEGSVRAQF